MHAQSIMAEITRYAVSQAWSDYDLRLDDDSSTVDRYEFNEAVHPRFAAGSPNSVGGEFRPTGMGGGGGSGVGGSASSGMSSRFNAGSHPQASQAQTSQSQQPQQPRTSKKRELADRPDIQKGHKLHFSELPDELRAKVSDWDYRMGQLLMPMFYAQSQVSPDKQEQALEQGWERVDKNQVRSMLAEMNRMDFDARSQGIPLADFVNANGVIPKMLGERLDGGARFFDPEKLRGKLGGGPQSNESSPSTKKWLDSQSKPAAQAPSPESAAIARQFGEASRTDRSKMLSNPSMREAIETAMGIKNPGGVVDPNLARPLQPEPKPGKPAKEKQPEEAKPTRSLKHLPEANRALRALGYKSSDAGALLRKVLAAGTPFSNADELVTAAMSSSAGSQSARASDDGLTSAGTNKLESAIANAVGGDDLDKKNYFKQVALDAWKQIKADADDHNDALRQIAGHFGKSLGTLASNLTQGVDTAKIKGFDQLIDHAVREYPQIVSRLMGESSAGGPEDALADALREGIRAVPQPWDDEVIDRAAGLVGPGFFEDSPSDQQTAASDEPWDGVPFSVRSDIVHWVQRYWYLEDIERYCQVEEWVERYAQLTFNWNESAHPREPAGADGSKGGEFTKRESKPTSTQFSGPKLKVMGTTEDHTTCERCGREDLKKTICVQSLDADGNGTGGFTYYGSECISKVMRVPIAKIERQALAADSEAKIKERQQAERLKLRPAPTKGEANLNYRKSNRLSTGSYLAEKNGQFVRVDGKDADDVKLFSEAGFVKVSEPIKPEDAPEESAKLKQNYPEYVKKLKEKYSRRSLFARSFSPVLLDD